MNDVNNIYYVCTRRVKFLKTDVLAYVLELFESKQATQLSLSEIYAYLQKRLQVTNVNISNLKQFLSVGASDKVFWEKVKKTQKLYLGEDDIGEDIPHFSNSALLKVIHAVNTLGLENLVNLLKSDGKTILNICQQLRNTAVQGYNSPIFNRQHHIFAEFLESFTEKQLITLCNDEKDFNELYNAFFEEYRFKEQIKKYATTIKNRASNIHSDNYNLRIGSWLNKDIASHLSTIGIEKVADILNLKTSDIVKIYQSPHSKIIPSIIDKLKYSLLESLQEIFANCLVLKRKSGNPMHNWQECLEMIKMRATGETLASIGDRFGLTRERVRQIEKRYLCAFNDFYFNKRGSVSGILRAFANSSHYLTVNELRGIFAENTNLFVYFLKQADNNMDFIPELDVFAYQNDLNWYEETLKIADNLPESLTIQQADKIAQDATDTFADLDIAIPFEYVKTIILADYKSNGTIYSRSGMSLAKKYDIVLRKYFPDGIHIYESSDMDRFRECYAKVFDDAHKLSENDRALYSRIAAVTILCDRGKYISIPDKLISEELLKEICDYIDSSSKEIFITNTLFYLFEDKLIAEGITNKYHLLGMMHAAVPNKYFFKRDYISKSKEATSLYGEITSFIKNGDGSVTKANIRNEFPGIPDIIIAMATQDDDIIVGSAVYLPKDFIVNQSENIAILREAIFEMVEDGEIHNSEDLMSVLSLVHPEIIEDFEIDSRYTLFSIIEFLFKNDFSLSRPFFAKKGIEIGKQEERMRDFLDGKDEVEIDDFMEFVRDNAFVCGSILAQLNAFNDEYLLKDKNTITRIELTGLNKYKAEYVDEYIDELIQGNEILVLRNLNYSFLPRINISWNDWLVYSVINKWSPKYKVITSDRQFRYSDPVVYCLDETPKDMEELLEIIKNKRGFDDIQMAKYMRERNLIF